MKKQKKAAMEMSVGTIVTIVLLMSVLVLGLVLIRTIYSSSIDNIKGIDEQIKGEIRKLFAEDNSQKVIIYPNTREIKIRQGDSDSGFGFAIRNLAQESKEFSYSVKFSEANCDIRPSEAERLISLGKEGSNLLIPAGNIMNDPVFVRFNIPNNVPPCLIRYNLQVMEGNTPYTSPIGVDLEILSQ